MKITKELVKNNLKEIKQIINEIETEPIKMEITFKLEWGKICENQLTWEDAKKWCKEQGNGWRLPTIVELELACQEKIPGFEAGSYWSSTEYSDTYAWLYDWPGPYRLYINRVISYYVRCVRGW